MTRSDVLTQPAQSPPTEPSRLHPMTVSPAGCNELGGVSGNAGGTTRRSSSRLTAMSPARCTTFEGVGGNG